MSQNGPPRIIDITPIRTTGIGSATTFNVSKNTPSLAASLLVMEIHATAGHGAGASSWDMAVTDTDGSNPWTILASKGDPATYPATWLAYRWNVPAGLTIFKVSATVGGAAAAVQFSAQLTEYGSIQSTSDPLIEFAANNGSGGALTASTVGSIDPGNLLLFGGGLAQNTNTQSFTAASGFTKIAEGTTSGAVNFTVQCRLGDQSAGIQSASSTPAVPQLWTAFIAAFAGAPQTQPGQAAVNVTGQTPTVQFTASGRPNPAAIALSGAAPTVRASLPVNPASVAITGSAPVLSIGRTITPSVGTISVQGQPGPTVTGIPVVAITPSAGAITLAGTNSLTRTVLTPVTGFIIYAGLSPPLDFRITPLAGAITLAGSPAVFNTNITTGTGSLAFAGTTPSFINGNGIAPPSGAITLTGTNSRVATTITPLAGSITLAGTQVVEHKNNIRVPVAGAIVLSGNAPTGRSDIQLTPFVGSINLTGQQVAALANTIRVPAAGTLTLAPTTPTLKQGFLLIPGSASVLLVGSSQNLSPGITPNAGALALTGGQVSSLSSTVFVPGTGALNFNGNAPALTYQFNIVPGSGALNIVGTVPRVSAVLIPGTGAITLDGQSRVIPQFATPGCGAITVAPGTSFVGTDVRVYGVELSER